MPFGLFTDLVENDGSEYIFSIFGLCAGRVVVFAAGVDCRRRTTGAFSLIGDVIFDFSLNCGELLVFLLVGNGLITFPFDGGGLIAFPYFGCSPAWLGCPGDAGLVAGCFVGDTEFLARRGGINALFSALTGDGLSFAKFRCRVVDGGDFCFPGSDFKSNEVGTCIGGPDDVAEVVVNCGDTAFETDLLFAEFIGFGMGFKALMLF